MFLPILLSALLYYLSFPNVLTHSGFSFLAWAFAVPLFHVLENSNLSRRTLAGFLFGILANLSAVNWVIPYHFTGYLFLSLVLAVQGAVFGALYRRGFSLSNIVYIPAAWVASEVLRRWLMLGESWDLGHTQTFDPYILQLANVSGSAGISFVLILVNYCLFAALRDRKHFKVSATVVGLALVLVLGYGFVSFHQEKEVPLPALKVVALQPNTDFRGELTSARISKIVDDNIVLTKEALKDHKSDLVIWPETAVPEDIIQKDELGSKIYEFVKSVRAPFIIGAVVRDGWGAHNSAVVLTGRGEVKQVYHKRHLVPLSEYIPDTFFWRTFAGIFGNSSFDFVPGEGPGVTLLPGTNIRLGLAICSEDNVASLFSEYARRGVRLAVVLLNNGWFSQESGLLMHGQHSIMRAVENGIPVLRVSNNGWSCLIDSFGRVVQGEAEDLRKKRYFYYEIPLSNHATLYNSFGHFFAVMCLGLALAGVLIGFFKKDKV